MINRETGPDFLNARIKIGDVLWVGHVEVYSQASDQKKQVPVKGATGKTTILHVIGIQDHTIPPSQGQKIPQFLLIIPDNIKRNYTSLKGSVHTPSCHTVLETLSKIKIHSWMTTLVSERFEQKTEAIRQRLERAGKDWETAFFCYLGPELRLWNK